LNKLDARQFEGAEEFIGTKCDRKMIPVQNTAKLNVRLLIEKLILN
jgi:hypothetical protein